jgi:FkbM family methyltransferase
MKHEALPHRERARQLLGEIAALPPAPGPRKAEKPLILYGAGNLGRMAKVLLDRIGIPVEAVVDANAREIRHDPFWQGTRLLAPDEVDTSQRSDCLLAVTIATLPWHSIAAPLRDAGWGDVTPFYDVAEAYRDRHPLGNGWFAGALDATDLRETAWVLDQWQDDASRAHHLQFIAWHCLREDWTFADAPVIADNRFFIPEIVRVLHDDEAFADLGAHTGTTCRRFIDEVQGRFRAIWAIEPDPDNLAALHGVIAGLPVALRERIAVLALAVSDAAREAAFFPGLGYASQCSLLGRERVRTQPLDALELTPSFVKLHLEGAELAALKGARDTVRRHRPIVVVTTYHDRTGIWKLPCWLMRELDDYVFHLRTHSWCGTGAVAYCIPRERMNHAPR